MDEIIFPKGFLWGAATSSHQVEGGNSENDWADWESAGRAREISGTACDHGRRFRDDFEMAKRLGHNAHRFSIEWSRVEPEEGQFDEAVLLHYREVVEALREKNLEPVVTLHHFTLPRWVAREGGFASPRFVQYFLRYADRVADALSDQIRYWVTINEPLVLLYKGYVKGDWPPGEHSSDNLITAFKNIILIHSELYRLLHAKRRNCWVGLAQHVRTFDPYRKYWPLDYAGVWLRRYFFNHFLLNICTDGLAFFPGIESSLLKKARDTMDFIGVNYYTRDFIKFTFSPTLGEEVSKPFGGETGERNSLGWEICPDGFYRMLASLKKFAKPVIVLENGVCTREDPRRIVFLEKHIKAMEKAMAKGVDIRGYFYWSLMDNFEWLDGFEPRFGLVEIDYKTQERRIRPSAEYYAGICRANKVSREK